MINENLPVICFIGPSGSGKTTIIEALISSLPKYNIGTIKFIHHPVLNIDPIGKDTQRHREAGAKFSLCFAQNETALIINRTKRGSLEDLNHFLQLEENVLPSIDFIFSEGPRIPPKNIPVVLTGKTKEDLKNYSLKLEINPILAISGIIGTKISSWQNRSVFNVYDDKSLKAFVGRINNFLKSHLNQEIRDQ